MRKSKRLVLPIFLLVAVLSATPVMAADYNFNTGFESDAFGRPTTSDVPPDYSEIQNVRRDKNSAYFPPSYGIFSGEFATDPTSKYHEQDRYNATVTSYNNVPYYAEDTTTGGFLAPTSTMMAANEYDSLNSSSGSANVYTNYTEPEPIITSVAEYADGSIGSLSIPRLNLNIKVYENTDLDTMKRGAGHFTFTSQWSGNVGLASHNRGSASYFKGIWNLENDDKITYTTKQGTRTYYVFNVVKVDETDLSYLAASSENMLTLTTCVENQSAYRWIVQARE